MRMKFQRIASILLAVLLLATSQGSVLIVGARVTEADKQKIEQQISKNDNDIEALKDKIKELKEDSAEAILIKEQLDAEAAVLQDNIDLTESLIDTYQQSIASTIVEISERQRAVDAQYDQIKTHLRASYENGNTNYLEIVFSSSSLTEMLTRTERLRSMMAYQENQIKDLEKQKKYLDTLRGRLEKDLAQSEVLKASLEEDKAALDVSLGEATDLIDRLNEQSDEAKRQQAAFERAEEELEKKLQNIIDELERQASAGMADGKYMWPVKTKYTRISSYFGWRTDPFTGQKKYHNGMDIPCSSGEPIYAANNGVVVTAEYNSSYGYYVMINHGDGITSLYAHNSKLLVSVGKTVKKGDVIAKAGSTGRSTGPHCHFEIRINGTRVDPLDKSNRGGAYVVIPK